MHTIGYSVYSGLKDWNRRVVLQWRSEGEETNAQHVEGLGGDDRNRDAWHGQDVAERAKAERWRPVHGAAPAAGLGAEHQGEGGCHCAPHKGCRRTGVCLSV